MLPLLVSHAVVGLHGPALPLHAGIRPGTHRLGFEAPCCPCLPGLAPMSPRVPNLACRAMAYRAPHGLGAPWLGYHGVGAGSGLQAGVKQLQNNGVKRGMRMTAREH